MYEIEKNIKLFIDQTHTNSLNRKYLLGEYRELKVEVGFGRGTPSKVPWMVFLAKGHLVYRGIYPAIYVYKEQGLIALCYGVSATSDPKNEWKISGLKMTIKEYFISNKIECKTFEKSYIYKIYTFEEFDLKLFIKQLDKLIDNYKNQIES